MATLQKGRRLDDKQLNKLQELQTKALSNAEHKVRNWSQVTEGTRDVPTCYTFLCLGDYTVYGKTLRIL